MTSEAAQPSANLLPDISKCINIIPLSSQKQQEPKIVNTNLNNDEKVKSEIVLTTGQLTTIDSALPDITEPINTTQSFSLGQEFEIINEIIDTILNNADKIDNEFGLTAGQLTTIDSALSNISEPSNTIPSASQGQELEIINEIIDTILINSDKLENEFGLKSGQLTTIDSNIDSALSNISEPSNTIPSASQGQELKIINEIIDTILINSDKLENEFGLKTGQLTNIDSNIDSALSNISEPSNTIPSSSQGQELEIINEIIDTILINSDKLENEFGLKTGHLTTNNSIIDSALPDISKPVTTEPQISQVQEVEIINEIINNILINSDKIENEFGLTNGHLKTTDSVIDLEPSDISEPINTISPSSQRQELEIIDEIINTILINSDKIETEIGLTTEHSTTIDSAIDSTLSDISKPIITIPQEEEEPEIVETNLINNDKIDSEFGLTTGHLASIDSIIDSALPDTLKPINTITLSPEGQQDPEILDTNLINGDKEESEIGLKLAKLNTIDSPIESDISKPVSTIQLSSQGQEPETNLINSDKIDSKIELITEQLSTINSELADISKPINTIPLSSQELHDTEITPESQIIDNKFRIVPTLSVISRDKVGSEIGLTTGQLTTIDSTPSTAFQTLNQELILGQRSKPNAIVRPMNFKKIESESNINNNNGKTYVETKSNNGKRSVIKKVYQQVETFAKELDLKLRRVKPIDKLSKSSKNSSNQDSINKRPLFVTTVPKGIFLPPNIAPVNHIYTYSSHPKIFTIYRPKNYSTVAEYFENSKDPNERRIVKREIYKNDREILKKSTASKLTAPKSKANRTIYNNEPNRGDSNQLISTYGNVMFDRRVVRGTNYAPCHIRPWNPYFAYAGLLSGKETDPDCKEAETKRRLMLRRRTLSRNRRCVIGTPPPICGRRHENVQTEKYLEELFERPPEYDVNTQTDLFLQRPPSPPYIPAKTGIDVATEILDGELFNFDSEVQPILETLVGHTVKQGLIEVLHEEEIAELKKQQEEFLALREADLAELRRLEAEEARLQAEKERRMRQDEIAEELDVKMQERVTASKLLQGHIANILPEVLASLEPATDAARKEDLERKVCPWLTKELADEVGQIVDSREILTAIIKEIIIERAKIYANYPEEEHESIDMEECLGEDCPEPEIEEECKCD